MSDDLVVTGVGSTDQDARAGESVVERVAAAIGAHPAVIRLDAGPLRSIATYLPAGRFDGVYLGDPITVARLDAHMADQAYPERVEVGVVLRLGHPLPQVVAESRVLVAELFNDLTGDVGAVGGHGSRSSRPRVDITVVDVG